MRRTALLLLLLASAAAGGDWNRGARDWNRGAPAAEAAVPDTLPLDGFVTNGGGDAGAWCLARKLHQDASDTLGKVINPDTGAEHWVLALASGWADTVTLATDVAASAWRVVLLYDQAGNGFHLTQATAGDQPAGDIDGGPGGGPCMVFAGAQWLAGAFPKAGESDVAALAQVSYASDVGTVLHYANPRVNAATGVGWALWAISDTPRFSVRQVAETAFPAGAGPVDGVGWRTDFGSWDVATGTAGVYVAGSATPEDEETNANITNLSATTNLIVGVEQDDPPTTTHRYLSGSLGALAVWVGSGKPSPADYVTIYGRLAP